MTYEYRRMSIEQNKALKAFPIRAEARGKIAKMYRDLRRVSPRLARTLFVKQRTAVQLSVASATANLFSCGNCDETTGLGALLRHD